MNPAAKDGLLPSGQLLAMLSLLTLLGVGCGAAPDGNEQEQEQGGDGTSFIKPDASNTGPRIPLTRTLTAEEALEELRATGKLSAAKVVGSFKLSGEDGMDWVIEDCRFEATSRYAIQGYSSLTPFAGTKEQRPVFRYVEIVGRAATGTGRSSAAVYGRDMVISHADIYGADDGLKIAGSLDLLHSWVHDNDHPEGAHCDAIQIRSGTDILVRGTRLDAYVGYSSDGSSSLGGTCSGALQTGSVTGPIQVRWENNWFAGGHYTIRGASNSQVDYTFRNNQWMRHGTSVVLGRDDLPPNRYGPVTSDLGDFDDSNVWEDTGEPVR